MTFESIVSNVIKTGMASYLFIAGACFAAPSIHYVSPMGEEEWNMSGNPLRCGLSLVIPNYGIGYFEQYATKQPHFIMRKWQTVQRVLPAQVVARPPIWKPYKGPVFNVARSFVKPGEFTLFLKREPALKLLDFLSQGYQANFNYLSEEGFNITVELSPIHFQKVYAKYQRCLGNLLPFDYNDVKETVFHFGLDSKYLKDEDKDKLRKIARYVAADPRIEKIRVVGYADESGRKGYNNAISEYRAEAIKYYLVWLGVPKSKLSVTWVGELFPIARNDTDEGRAENRRVVVTLIKQ